MADETRVIELEIKPYPPDTVAETRQKIVQDIKSALQEAGYAEALQDRSIQIDLRQNTGIELLVVYAVLRLAEHVLEKGAMAVINGVVVPKLRQHYNVKEKAYIPPKYDGTASADGSSDDLDSDSVGSGAKDGN